MRAAKNMIKKGGCYYEGKEFLKMQMGNR